MEGLRVLAPGSVLAAALERERGRYNARVALARRGGRLELPRLAGVLAEAVAPALEAVAASAPGRVDACCEALFDLALELVGQEVLGVEARHPAVQAAWRELLPALARHLAEAPRRVAAAVTNAAVHLQSITGARPMDWVGALGALSPACPDADTLLACGQVLAWRAGAAHWRASALRIWERLPEPLARTVLGLPAGDATPREALGRSLAEDPYRTPGTSAGRPGLRRLGRVGGFRGFGGPFLAPPRLASDGERIWALDGEDGYTLHADCFGRTVVRTSGAPAEAGGGGAGPQARAGAAHAALRLDADGTLRMGELRARFPELAGARAVAAAGSLVAVLPPQTHLVVLVARTSGEGP